MPWQIIFTLYLGFAVALTLARRKLALSNTIPASLVTAVSYVLGVMPISILVGLAIPHEIAWSGWTIGLLAIEGLCIGAFNWIALVAIKHLPAAHFQTIFQLNAVVIIALGWILLGETLSIAQLMGGVLILGSGILAIWAPAGAGKQAQCKPADFRRGVALTLVGTVVMGVGLVAEKAALGHMDVGAYFIYGFGAQCIAVLLIACTQVSTKHLKLLTKKRVGEATLLGLIGVGVGFTYIAALALSGNVSLISALKAIALPLTAVAAHFALKERDNSKMLWAAILLGVCGIVLVAL